VKFDPSNRPEIVIGPKRAKWVRIVLLLMMVAASFLVITGLLVWLRHRNVNTDVAQDTTTFAFYFVLIPSLVLFFLTMLALAFSPRRNATFRMVATLSGGAMVMCMVPFQQSPFGIFGTLLGLVVIGMVFWPDKQLKAERAAADNEPI
jgi:hypothetical protein